MSIGKLLISKLRLAVKTATCLLQDRIRKDFIQYFISNLLGRSLISNCRMHEYPSAAECAHLCSKFSSFSLSPAKNGIIAVLNTDDYIFVVANLRNVWKKWTVRVGKCDSFLSYA